MLYCYIARRKPAVGLIYPVLLLETHAHADMTLNLTVSGVKLWTVIQL